MWRMFRDARILGIAGLVLFAGIIGILNATTFSAEQTVLRYLSALEDGRTADAITAVWGKGVAVDLAIALPSDPAHRPHNARITKVSRGDERTLVTATVDLGGKLVTSTFALRQFGGWSPLAEWRFDVDPLATVSLTSTAVTPFSVNGAVSGRNGYTFVPVIAEIGSGSDWFETEPVTIAATDPAGSYFTDLTFTPSDALLSDVDQSIHKYLDACAAQKTLVPAECPFAGFTFERIAKGPNWSIDSYPTIAVAHTDGEWTVTGKGKVRLRVSLVDFATEKTTKYSELIPYTISATIADLNTAKPRLVVANTVER